MNLTGLNMAKEKGSTKFNGHPVGSPYFMSISAHDGIIEEKDDMIALGFSLCHIYRNSTRLPWKTEEIENMKGNDRLKKIKEVKEETVMQDWVNKHIFFFFYFQM